MSLKLKQYVRARQVEHVIRLIQQKCVEDSGNQHTLQQDFGVIGSSENIVQTAQIALHKIIEYNRSRLSQNFQDKSQCKMNINLISSINVSQFLKKNGKTLSLCVYKNSFKDYETLLELVREAEVELDRKRSNILEMILENFPKEFIQLSLTFDDNINETYSEIKDIQLINENWVQINDVTVKQLQATLKVAMGKVTTLDVKSKVGINNFDNENFIKLRLQCINTKMRSTYYRMVNNDFFSHERMFKFKMTNEDKCPRCNNVESTKHLLWECHESKNIWDLLNSSLHNLNLNEEKILEYSDVYKVTNNISVTHIKMQIIQEMIQIKRPSGWNKERISEVIQSVMNIEKYIAVKNKTVEKWVKKWKHFNATRIH
jgi:hypothetical protein